jgi:hypothetical protein
MSDLAELRYAPIQAEKAVRKAEKADEKAIKVRPHLAQRTIYMLRWTLVVAQPCRRG